MPDPGFDLLHGFAGLDCSRAGHAADALPSCFVGIAQVRVGSGERLAFHRSSIVDSDRTAKRSTWTGVQQTSHRTS